MACSLFRPRGIVKQSASDSSDSGKSLNSLELCGICRLSFYLDKPLPFSGFSAPRLQVSPDCLFLWASEKVKLSVFERHGPEVKFLGPGRRKQCWPTWNHLGEDEDTNGREPDSDPEAPFTPANLFPSSCTLPPHAPYPAVILAVPLVHRRSKGSPGHPAERPADHISKPQNEPKNSLIIKRCEGVAVSPTRLLRRKIQATER